ncbi:MFS transporter [Brevibacillus sp. HB1.4B]|uniref:MFS transporter n=1 Tax=unclassified Brevibacillus TaxID=2684853 RepID=UPI00156B7AB6|nr:MULTISPECIES: MFS transporter [unclassified Brevibacillus]NRS15635.1 MFS transporter [Brevibacillus sp. HB1.4B]
MKNLQDIVEGGAGENWSAGKASSSKTDARASTSHSSLPRRLSLLFAVACGLAVANVYYAQPLLDAMAVEFGIRESTIGVVVTITQIGYALGLLLLVPLGDLLNRRRLIVGQSALSVAALAAVGFSPNSTLLFISSALVGLLAVVTQVLVAFSAALATPAERGRVVGTVTSGIVIGILLARTIAGFMADLAGWRAIYFLSAALTLLITVMLFRVLPPHDEVKEKIAYPQLLRSVFMLFLEEPILRIRALIAFLIFTSTSVLWTPMVFPLSQPPFSLSHTEIGLFGLAGAAGALGAARAGQMADRGWSQKVSGTGLLIMSLSWLPIGFTIHSLWALIAGVIVFDLGLQAVHVTNQSMIYSVRPEAHSRLTAGYMIFYSLGSAVGSFLSTFVYAWAGWSGVCLLGSAISFLALLFWAFTRQLTPTA